MRDSLSSFDYLFQSLVHGRHEAPAHKVTLSPAGRECVRREGVRVCVRARHRMLFCLSAGNTRTGSLFKLFSRSWLGSVGVSAQRTENRADEKEKNY